MLGSIAAYGTVLSVSAVNRKVVLRTASGGVVDVTFGPGARGFERMRPGMRGAVEYDAEGGVRIGFLRPGEGTRWGRILGTVQEIEPGGRFVTITDQQGNTVTFELPHPSMMAFATRLTRGDDVAVTVFGQN